MKVLSPSIALLGLPVALAAVAATFNNAAPTRPDIALGLPEPSPQPGAFGELVQETRQEVTVAETNDEQREEEQDWHELLRRAAAAEAEPASPPVHNTFTHINKTTSSATVTAATEIAVFTAAGAVFTVTEISGQAAVDGKSLTPGGPAQLIGGEYVSENSKGNIVANGQTLSFEAFSSSSQAPSRQPAASSSAAASSSSGAAGGQGGSTSTSGGAGPIQTAAANVVAIVGAVVGAMVL